MIIQTYNTYHFFYILLIKKIELNITNEYKGTRMEKRLNKKLESYITEFKDNIKEKTAQLELINDDRISQLIQYIYDYDRISFGKEDFQKRKRVKNFVPIYDRCCAKRASNEQCTRRKKENEEFCGTHMKGIPHGMMDIKNDEKVNTQKVEVWAQDIQGIVYYIDKSNNVYDTTDIIKNQMNPKIIAKYVVTNEIYRIPELNI